MREKNNNNDNVICILNRMSKVGNFQTTTIATTNSDYIRECMFIHTVKDQTHLKQPLNAET